MSWLRLDAYSATIVATAMLGICVCASRLSGRAARFVTAASFEVAVVCGLFALWQVANSLTRGHTTGGVDRGQWLWHAERVIHLPSERSVQDLIINHPLIVRAANYYYDTAHLTLMVVFLVWLWLRHRDRYSLLRNTIAAFTAMSLLIQMVAVAPPRLIGGTGLIDTAQVYGQSVYAAIGSGLADEYAAMPSIHVGWAVLISLAIVTCSPSRWRWLGLLHGLITIFVVVATANHYWLDGIAACALLVPAYLIARGIDRLSAQLRPAEAAADLELDPVQIQQGAFS
ncbi:MAG TPA: phosphatase PAP2 family protein [Mycobacteriales bacterium]|nr:phosphatase PAP2 family protein [Mycobacteriales bacterium]